MTDHYIADQLDQVFELEEGGYLLKIVGEKSQTKFLLITSDQLDRIREVLTGSPTRTHPMVGVEYLNTQAAAARLHVSTSTVTKWLRSGVLKPTWRTAGGQARFTAEDLDKQRAEVNPRRGSGPVW